MRWVCVVLLAAGAARAETPPLFEWKQPTIHETIALAVPVTLIWVDVLQTLDWQGRGWPTPETNPVLGPRPSRARLIGVGGLASSLVLAAVWYALPSEWRMFPCAGVTIIEINTISMNSAQGMVIRF